MRDRSQSPLLPIVTSHPTHPEHLPWASLQGLDAFAEPAELGFCCIGLVYGVLLTSLLVLYFAALHWPCSCSLQLFFSRLGPLTLLDNSFLPVDNDYITGYVIIVLG